MWLREVLDDRCPGFLENADRTAEGSASTRPLHFCLEDWIEHKVFGSAKRDNWFNAVAYYAIRDPRYQRAEVCWAKAGAKKITEKKRAITSRMEQLLMQNACRGEACLALLRGRGRDKSRPYK